MVLSRFRSDEVVLSLLLAFDREPSDRSAGRGAKTEEGTWEMGHENKSTYKHEDFKTDGDIALDQRGDQLCDNNGG